MTWYVNVIVQLNFEFIIFIVYSCFSLGQLDRMNKQKKYAMEIKAALDVVKEFQVRMGKA